MRQRFLSFAAPICVFFFIIAPLVEYRAVVPVMASLGLCCLIDGRWLETRRSIKRWRPLLVCLAAIIIWTGVTILWAADPGRGFATLVKLIGNIFVGIIVLTTMIQLRSPERRWIVISLFAGTGCVAFYLMVNGFLGGSLDAKFFSYTYHPQYGFFWHKPAMTLLTILSIILAFWTWSTGRRLLALSLIVATVFLADAVGLKSGPLALGLASAVFILVYVSGKKLLFGCAVIAIIGMVLMPFPLQHINASEVTTAEQSQTTFWRSITHRLLIWEFTSEKISEKPITGWGVGAARVFGGIYNLDDEKHQLFTEAIPLHPHNGALHVWLELGVVGIALASALLWIITRSIAQVASCKLIGASAMAMVTTCMFFWIINFGIWSSWWQTYLWFTSAMMAMLIATNLRPPDRDEAIT